MNKPFFKKFFKILLFDLLLLAAVCGFLWVFNLLTGQGCPFKWALGIDCPFCGMTRAHLAFFSLNFKAAFSYHPLFFLGLPTLFLLTHSNHFGEKLQKPLNITALVFLAAILAEYFVSGIICGFC